MSTLPRMTIPEMYSLVSRQEKDWGVKGYKIPKKYFDHKKSKKKRELLDASNKHVIYILTKYG